MATKTKEGQTRQELLDRINELGEELRELRSKDIEQEQQIKRLEIELEEYREAGDIVQKTRDEVYELWKELDRRVNGVRCP